MKPFRFTSSLLIVLLLITSCEPWTLEKRPDHDFITFVSTIQDNADKESWGILYDQAGYIVVGSTEETGSGNPDVYMVKVNEQGIYQWHSSFGDSDPEHGTGIVKLAGDQGYAVIGNKQLGGTDWQMYLIRSDLQGSKIWEEKYGWIKEDKSYSLVQQTGGGFLMLGHSNTWESANLGTEAVIYKALDDGTEETRYNFGNPIENGSDLDDFGYLIDDSGDGNYLLLGTFEDKNVSGSYNVHLLKLNGSSLAVIWDRKLIENCHPINASFVRLSDGFAVLGALTTNKLSLVRTGLNGTSTWSRSFDNSDCADGASVCLTDDGGFLIMSSGMTLIKTDETGLEQQRADLSGKAFGNRCILQAGDGGYVFTGTFDNGGKQELKIIKIYPDLENSVPEL